MKYYLYTLKPEKSNSSWGTWAVRISDVSMRFFWSKKQALQFIKDVEKGLQNDEIAFSNGTLYKANSVL